MRAQKRLGKVFALFRPWRARYGQKQEGKGKIPNNLGMRERGESRENICLSPRAHSPQELFLPSLGITELRGKTSYVITAEQKHPSSVLSPSHLFTNFHPIHKKDRFPLQLVCESVSAPDIFLFAPRENEGLKSPLSMAFSPLFPPRF